MSTYLSSGSPPTHGTASGQFVIHEESESPQLTPTNAREESPSSKHVGMTKDSTTPLTTTKLGNALPSAKQKVDHGLSASGSENQLSSMDVLLAKLSEQQVLLEKQKNALSSGENHNSQVELDDSISGSVPLTPATDSFNVTPSSEPDDDDKTIQVDTEAMLRLKKELDAAKDKIARQEHELSQTRVIKRTLDQAMGSLHVPRPNGTITSKDETLGDRSEAGHPSTRVAQDDSQSEFSEVLTANSVNRAQSIWSNTTGLGFGTGASIPNNHPNLQQSSIWGPGSGRSWMNRPMNQGPPSLMVPQPSSLQQRALSGPSSPTSSTNGRFSDFGQFQGGLGLRRSNTQSTRAGSAFVPNRNNDWDTFSMVSDGGSMNGMNPINSYQPPSMFQQPMTYQPRPIGTPLSPTAAEFTIGNMSNGPWNAAPPSSPGQTYVSPMEPLNYRRLLDRSVTCNWKYIVDKIVCNNDQQASIFLQQKLKVGTAEQKFEIVEAIVAQAYPLMVNRFGNFLVQRCFEHGTPEQVIAIANAIRGNTLSLSMDAFGCHVVQKAFDAVPEDYKAIMVHELLRRIPETVIHRYACHVWQKLFELRWSDSPPQIMKYVNEALRGMWHEVALGETGSLVVQNIFENCLEEDKRLCINEVLGSIDIVAHGQFGNWCIQHICEHGAPADRSRAIDHVLRFATEYSMDQFASKVVEKCLKIGGAEFLERYLERVCEGRSDRPRIPLIDIASDQYGNYLIQYILTHANSQHREVVASHIRKHMVSLRGSKFGSRVGMLCCNPAYATRPGPAVGPSVTRLNNNNMQTARFGNPFR